MTKVGVKWVTPLLCCSLHWIYVNHLPFLFFCVLCPVIYLDASNPKEDFPEKTTEKNWFFSLAPPRVTREKDCFLITPKIKSKKKKQNKTNRKKSKFSWRHIMGRKKHLLQVKSNLFLILAFKHVRTQRFSKQKAHIPFILRISFL